MEKNDYKTEFEEDRKEIGIDDGHDVDDLPSRVKLHSKGRKPKKKSRHMMINTILGLFTLIPVIILVYVVTDFYSPDDHPEAKVKEPDVRYETGSGKTDEPDKDITLGGKDDVNKKDSEEDEAGVGKVESESKPDTEADAKPKPETKPVEKPVTKPVVDVDPKPEKIPVQKPTGKTHKVAANETLYRISVNYYGSDIGVEKIKQANGLSSNNISIGQTLIIP